MNDKNRKVISVSLRKNIEMVVYHNVGPDGKKDSLTKHEVLDPKRPAFSRFKKPIFTR